LDLLLVCGARPNFVKIAPLVRAIKKRVGEVSYCIVHTGQHYDDNLSEVFFRELNLPKPDINLGVGSSTHAKQTAKIMEAFEDICIEKKPDVVVVVGDVNSTLACSVVVSKLPRCKLAHVEAGERNFRRSVPEEVNRVVTDTLSDFNFCCTNDAMKHLEQEGIPKSRRFLVGNVMIDSLIYNLSLTENIKVPKGPYALLTIHRADNTDNKGNLQNILKAAGRISEHIPLIFPVHPRTRKQVRAFQLEVTGKVNIIDPLGYLEFLALMKNAKVVLTDSGSIQVETTFLEVPCLTIRDFTSLMFTLTEGTNTLVGTEVEGIVEGVSQVLLGKRKKVKRDKLWDGKASERTIDILLKGV